MVFKLAIDTPNSIPHPVFEFDTCEEALRIARVAIQAGFYENGGAYCILIQTGPGTVYRVVSDEHLALPNPPRDETPWKLVVIIHQAELSPLGFNSEADVDSALEHMRIHGYFQHEVRPGHDYMFVEGAPGAIFMKMTAEAFIEKKSRMFEEMQRRKAAAEEQKRTGRTKGGLIIGGN